MADKKIVLIVAAIVVVTIGAGAFLGLNTASLNQVAVVSSGSEGSAAQQAASEVPAEAPTQTPVQSASESKQESKSSSYSGQLIAGSTTPYIRYNAADFEKAMSEGKAVYLYFYATWCPICAIERPKILSAFDGLDLKDAVGFEAHWSDGQNTQADDNLARDYGVASQHTHIFIGKGGNVIEKTLAGLSSDDIRMKLSEAAGA